MSAEARKHPESPRGRATLYVDLPEDLARRAEAADRESPGYIARVLQYALMRFDVHRHLRKDMERHVEKQIHG